MITKNCYTCKVDLEVFRNFRINPRSDRKTKFSNHCVSCRKNKYEVRKSEGYYTTQCPVCLCKMGKNSKKVCKHTKLLDDGRLTINLICDLVYPGTNKMWIVWKYVCKYLSNDILLKFYLFLLTSKEHLERKKLDDAHLNRKKIENKEWEINCTITKWNKNSEELKKYSNEFDIKVFEQFLLGTRLDKLFYFSMLPYYNPHPLVLDVTGVCTKLGLEYRKI